MSEQSRTSEGQSDSETETSRVIGSELGDTPQALRAVVDVKRFHVVSPVSDGFRQGKTDQQPDFQGTSLHPISPEWFPRA